MYSGIVTADTAEDEEAAITFFSNALNAETGLPKLFTIGGGLQVSFIDLSKEDIQNMSNAIAKKQLRLSRIHMSGELTMFPSYTLKTDAALLF